MPLLAWDARFELGVPLMDTTHQEFVELVNALGESEDAQFLACLDRLLEHTVRHFEEENRWMEESAFGPVCHIGEHQHVLDVIRMVRERVAGGDLQVGRKLAGELAPWFEHHASTMDTILASHMTQVGYDPGLAKTPASEAA